MGFQVQGKILVGLLQIVSELPSVLRLEYPAVFTAALSAIRVLIVDIFEIFKLDCVSPLPFHTKYLITMLLPWVCALLILLFRLFQDCRASRDGASVAMVAQRKAANKSTAVNRCLFVVFLLYPLLSKTCFHIFACRYLNDSGFNGIDAVEVVHEDDYSIHCNSSKHIAFEIIAVFGTLIYPIGIPVSFFIMLHRDRAREQHEVKTAVVRQMLSKSKEKAKAVGSLTFLRKDCECQPIYGAVVQYTL